MRLKKPIILIIALLVVSCSQEGESFEVQQPQTANAISFSAVMAPMNDADTRADAEVSLSELKAGTGFGVLASYTGVYRYGETSVLSNFMHNQQVEWEDAASVWTYSPVKYWPGGEGENGEVSHYVSFFAYAPYSDAVGTNPVGYCISGFSDAREQGDPWLTYRLHPDISKQVDLLYAKQIDMKRPTVDVNIEFAFEHALACVGDVVTIAVDDELVSTLHSMVTGSVASVEVIITDVSITYTLAEKGRLVLWNRDGVANWQAVLSESLTTTRVPTITATLPKTIYSYNGSAETVDDWEDSGHGVFFIPIDGNTITQKATVSVKYQVVLNGSVVFTTQEASADISLGSYAGPAKKVALKISLSKLS